MKYSIPPVRYQSDSSQFSSDSSDQWIPFYPRKERSVYRRRRCRINSRGSPIRDKNNQRRKKKAIRSFLTSVSALFLSPSLYHPLFSLSTLPPFFLSLPLSLYLSLTLPLSLSPSLPPLLSPFAVQAVVRGVCSGSLTCCMLFCPGRSAILVF